MNAAEYRTAADALFTRWKQCAGTVTREGRTVSIDHRNHVFIRDGVVCPEIWFDQPVRPLFLLKEAYGGDADWDLTGWLLGAGTGSRMWKRVARWTRGLLDTTTESVAPYSETGDAEAALRHIAVVNVKKSSGGKASDLTELRAYGEFDRERLMEQLVLCDPTVIVCGYTGFALDIIGGTVREPGNPELFYTMILSGHPVLVLDYWHPANHYPDVMNYYGLMGIYHQALKGNAYGR